MTSLHDYTTEDLASIFSDYYKDVHGIRPRWPADREALIAGIEALDRYMDMMKSTPEGREELRADGWVIDEPAT